MPKPFYSLTLEEFIPLLHQFPFKRSINAVHLHHTLRPNHEQYNGMASIEALWRFQTQTKGLSDVAQHLTIAPDGKIWTGRNWDQPPVSAAGHNGNAVVGPFMISIVGDFNEGGDSFSGDQREVTLQIIALVQQLFRLPVDSLQFHSQMSLQSCPGSSIKYAEIKSAVSKIHTRLKQGKGKSDGRKGVDKSPFGPEAQEGSDQIQKIIETISHDVSGRGDPTDIELNDDEMTVEETELLTGQESVVLPAPGQPKQTRAARAACDPALPQVRSALRPHVINLNQGQFSGSGQYTTQLGDVDAIFGEHLEQAMAEAKKNKKKLKLLFYAHGGLVKEADGLCAAYKQIPWWLDNQVYPLYFVWETGFFETIGQLLFGAQQRAGLSRDIYDFTTDPIIEATVRRLGGVQIWAGMKRSAEQAVRTPSNGAATFDGGGAYYVAEKLKGFCDKHGDGVELHAVGHSAGSIFHAHFLPTVLDLGVPSFQSVHLLAPAIRTDDFSRLLTGRIGHGIDYVTIFTMAKDWELADHCANIYHKSLLYLLYYGLESERKTPILGLEESLRADANLAALFGMNGHASKVGEVVLAKSAVTSGRSATASTSHGGFDDDPATMNSVLRRVLGLNETVQITGYPATASRDVTNLWGDFTLPLEESRPYGVSAYPAAAPAPVQPQRTAAPPGPSLPPSVPTAGRRRALCVGIDTYRTSPLNGCVADAKAWTDSFQRLNFEVTLLRNNDATHDAILKALSDLVESSLPGDVVAFQYAGHGTQVKDLDQDEEAGDSPQMDEAICPVDYDQGRLIIDDDIAAIFARIPDGVNVTCFMDCCHSGTISRFGVGVPEQDNGANLDERPRYIVADAALEEAHRRFRASQPKFRAAASTRGPSTMKEVLFSACSSNEVAWESNGHGDFTTRATPILNAGLAGLTHDLFEQRVIEAFGATPRQHPELDCALAANDRPLLQPLTGPVSLSKASMVNTGAGQNGVDGLTAIAQGLRLLADLLTQRS